MKLTMLTKKLTLIKFDRKETLLSLIKNLMSSQRRRNRGSVGED